MTRQVVTVSRAEPFEVSRDIYARDLRAIGDDLESKHIEDFELKSDGINYLMRVEAWEPPPKKSPKDILVEGLHTLWQKLQQREPRPVFPADFEQRYTPEDIDRLDREGWTRRQQSHKMPGTESLSQVLRAVGAYLDLKGAHLLGVSKRGPWITLRYKTAEGGQELEEFMISTLYDFCVRMYIQRKDRKN